ncbi:hypothetical protein DPMN_087275 [Dreissena polymorpha]|uniref:Uncharacterized protein n=1 Tax=Dreissena polymorpha TaxID=45954 RepID=A0A9D4KTW2_DREPO|nr:hypothetical protein DPMN_087275 [Dreissena polymorpha]
MPHFTNHCKQDLSAEEGQPLRLKADHGLQTSQLAYYPPGGSCMADALLMQGDLLNGCWMQCCSNLPVQH